MELLQIACAPFLTAALTAAAKSGIADRLQVGPRRVEDLAAEADLDPAVLLRVMRLLVGVQVFKENEDGSFENNAKSEPLQSDHPSSVRHFCILAGAEYYKAFGEIMYTARTGEPAFQHLYGESVYGYMDHHPEAAGIYDRAMEDLAAPVARLLAKKYDFSAARKVVDVGGGAGALIKGLLTAYPSMTGICLDRAEVCERGERRVAQAEGNLAERLSFMPGDFFVEVPRGADYYLLKNVVHNWSSASSLRILQVIRSAMLPESRLMLIEPVLEDGPASLPRMMDDLFQMVICEKGTVARTQPQLTELLEAAGFVNEDILRLPSGHAVFIERVSNKM